MRYGILRLFVVLCVVAILGGLTLHLVAGPLCLRAQTARSVSGCQRCCQPDTTPEPQAQMPGCSLFCCTGLPGALGMPIPPILILAVALPVIHDLSTWLAPAPPPPKLSLSIQNVCDDWIDSETMEEMIWNEI